MTRAGTPHGPAMEQGGGDDRHHHAHRQHLDHGHGEAGEGVGVDGLELGRLRADRGHGLGAGVLRFGLGDHGGVVFADEVLAADREIDFLGGGVDDCGQQGDAHCHAPALRPAGRQLLLLADRRVPHGDVVTLVNLARAVGVQRVNVAVKPE